MEPVSVPHGFRLLGPSTRRVVLTTGESVQFSRESLERAVTSANSRFIPQPVEHLHYLPPVGRLAESMLIEAGGDVFLAGRELPLAAGTAEDLQLPQALDEDGDEGAQAPVLGFSITFATEPRNFEDADMGGIRADAPVDLGDIALHSDLPPIIWSFLLSGGAAGGLYGAKLFLNEFMTKVGAASADAFVDWLGGAARKARRADREQMVEFRFELDSGLVVLAFCPFSPASRASLATLRESLERLGDVAVFAGSTEDGGVPPEMRQAAFIWSSQDGWRLAWWASDDASYVTPWFRKHAPDPERFLGYSPPTLRLLEPYMPELPGAGAGELPPGRATPSPGGSLRGMESEES
jgi:hypothetical protein